VGLKNTGELISPNRSKGGVLEKDNGSKSKGRRKRAKDGKLRPANGKREKEETEAATEFWGAGGLT